MTTDWHGYEIISNQPPVSIHIGHLPGRKQVCLYINETKPWVNDKGEQKYGALIKPLAFFRNEDDAALALALMDLLVGAKPEDPGIYEKISPERMIRKQK